MELALAGITEDMRPLRSILRRLSRLPPFADTNGPGIGPDHETPLGDTTEVHDEITPRDLPLDHPAVGRRRGRRLVLEV